MDKLNKIKQFIKKIKSGVLKLQDLNPKEKLAIIKEQLMSKLKIFLLQAAGWVVLGCLIVGVLLLCLAGLLEIFKKVAEFFGAVWDGIQYVFIGTKADVNSDDIKAVREELTNMGVDFDEIGYIGAIQVLGGVEDVQQYIDNVESVKTKIVDDIIKKADELNEKKVKAKEKYDELERSGASESELNSAKTKLEDVTEELSRFEDKYIEFYVRKYLEAQSQTGAPVNELTYSDDKGAIRVKVTETVSSPSIWQRFKAWITGSYTVKNENGKFYTQIGNNKMDITDEVYQIYMPWQYPFAFHNETMSPDVGYLVATLSRYHYLNLIVDSEEILTIEIDVDEDDGSISIKNKKWVDGAEIVGDSGNKVSKDPIVMISEACTWYSTYKYTYYYTGDCSEILEYDWDDDDPTKSKFDESSKQDLLNAFTVENDVIYYTAGGTKQTLYELGFESMLIGEETVYYKKFGMDSESAIKEYEVVETDDNRKGKEEMTKILLPMPEYDDKGKVTNESALPKYYIANRSTKQGNTYTGERSILNIKTNSDTIIRSIDEIYKKDGTTKEIMAGDNEPKGKDYLNQEKFEAMKEDTGKDYLSAGGVYNPQMHIKMVADIVEFFASNGIIDGGSYSMMGASGFANLDVLWFLDEDASIDNITSGNPATITANAGTTVFAPVTGEITDVDESTGTVIITKYGTYEEAIEAGVISEGAVVPGGKVPLMIIKIDNIDGVSNTMVGQNVIAGSTTLGTVKGETGTKSSIQYTHISGDGSVETSSKVTQELTNAVMAENSQFMFPLPANSGYRLTSSFGPRVNPVTGVYQKAHGALDFGVGKGTPILASAAGKITHAGWAKGYGYCVYIDHGNGYSTRYAHMWTNPCVSAGQEVEKGQKIGEVGSTGNSTGNHLHFEIRINNDKVDPMNYIGQFIRN